MASSGQKIKAGTIGRQSIATNGSGSVGKGGQTESESGKAPKERGRPGKLEVLQNADLRETRKKKSQYLVPIAGVGAVQTFQKGGGVCMFGRGAG